MIPRRKSRSMSLAPVELGVSPTLSATCCMAAQTGPEIRTKTERETGEIRGVSQA